MDSSQIPSSTGPTPPVTANAINIETAPSPDNQQLQAPAAAPANIPALQPPAPTQPAIPPHVSKLATLGHIASSLMGTQYQYSIDPKTGQQVQTAIKSKPGDLFRHMVAGALMGGAAAEGSGDPTAGFFKGGAAVAQDSRQQDLLRRSQAQEQFKNSLTANKEQREQQEFQTQQELAKIQIAHANLQTVHEQQLIDATGFANHEAVANFGKAQMQPFLDAGIKPVYRDVSESDMHDLIKNSPSASLLYWEPTGVKISTGPDGHPTHEETYTAINPKGKVTVTQGLLDAWDKSGLLKYDPELANVVKPGYEMDARDFMTVNNRAQAQMNTTLQNQKEQAQIDEAKAGIKYKLAEAGKAYAELAEIKEGKNKAATYNKAIAKLNEVGDFDKLPLGYQQAISEGTKPQLDSAEKAFTAAAATARASGDPEDKRVAADAYRRWSALNDLNNGLLKTATAKAPAPNTPAADLAVPRAQALFQSNPNSADAYQYVQKQIAAKAITPEEGQHIMGEYMKLQQAPKQDNSVRLPAPDASETAPAL